MWVCNSAHLLKHGMAEGRLSACLGSTRFLLLVVAQVLRELGNQAVIP
jgi:hypothetical protein